MAETRKPPTVEEVRANRPSVGATVTQSRPMPLGVPEFTMGPDGQPVPFAAEVGGAAIPPTFFDGDELRPTTLPPGQVARLQEILNELGMLDEYRRGIWDPNSQKAYKQVLEYANAAGIDDPQIALQRIGQSGGIVKTQTPRQPLTVRKSNPLTIKEDANKVARSVLGRTLRDDELPSVIAAIQGLETKVQTAAYNTEAVGGTVTEAPTLASFVEQKLRLDNPVEAKTMDELDAGAEFFDLLKGSGGGGGS